MFRVILICLIFISTYVYASVLDEQHQQKRIYKGILNGNAEGDALFVEIDGRFEKIFVSSSYLLTEYDFYDSSDLISSGFETTTFSISAGTIIDFEDKAFLKPKATFGYSEGHLQTVKALTEKIINIGFDLGFAINNKAVLITSYGISTIFSSNVNSLTADLLNINEDAFENDRESQEVYGSVELRNKIKDIAYINVGISRFDGVYTSYIGACMNL